MHCKTIFLFHVIMTIDDKIIDEKIQFDINKQQN